MVVVNSNVTDRKGLDRGRGMARVAAVQFATGTDVDQNLATCLRMIDAAAEQQPDIVVLPEFCNHLSWYDDDDHAWRVAVPEGGAFLGAVAAKAAEHQCYVVINVSCQRQAPAITVTSFLFGPDGATVAYADKQTLMGHENDYFVRAEQTSPVVETPFGQLGLFPCRDGVTCETPRGLALRGAQLFCDSLNSFALDEASLHIPARAPENKVFLVAANKVGPLIPEPLLEPVSEVVCDPEPDLSGDRVLSHLLPGSRDWWLPDADCNERRAFGVVRRLAAADEGGVAIARLDPFEDRRGRLHYQD